MDFSKLKNYLKKQKNIQIDSIISVIIFFLLGIFITGSSFTLWPLYRIRENIQYLFATENPLYNSFQGIQNNLFLEVFNKLRYSYLPTQELPNEKTLVEKATTGLLKSLKDPYTYIEKIDQEKDLKVVGIMLDYNSEGIVGIREIAEESSAFLEGIRQGDIIMEINNTNVLGKEILEIKSLIKASPDSFKMTVFRSKDNLLLEKDIKKQVLKDEENVTLKQTEVPSIYILKINSFTKNSSSEFFEVLKNTDLKSIEGLIIDLRDNTGGDTSAARQIIETFLVENQTIMSQETRTGKRTVYKANTSKYPKLVSIPKVILVNNLSASCSEIFSLALKDNQKVPLIGAKTYGKGLITEELQVSTEDILNLTVAKWFGPNGENIDKTGITPDFPEEENIIEQATNVLRTLNPKL